MLEQLVRELLVAWRESGLLLKLLVMLKEDSAARERFSSSVMIMSGLLEVSHVPAEDEEEVAIGGLRWLREGGKGGGGGGPCTPVPIPIPTPFAGGGGGPCNPVPIPIPTPFSGMLL